MRVVARASREAALLAALFVAYKAVRLAVAGRVDVAFDNAHRVLSLEQLLQIDVEHGAQRLVLHSEGLIVLLNRFYVTMHFASFVVFLIWLFVAHREHYVRIRRLIVGSTAIALALHAVFPLAPPRMLSGFVDTMAVFGPNAYASSAVASTANQHAAMPSVHFMWAAIVAYGVIRCSRSRFRWVILAHPIITTVAIVATANHFVLDAVVGGGLVLLALAVERLSVQVHAPQPAPAAVSAGG